MSASWRWPGGVAPIHNVWRTFLSFQLGLDERLLWRDSVDSEGRIIENLAASFNIIWKPEPDGEQIAGTVPQAVLLITCILDALGRARGGHTHKSSEAGLPEMQQLNLVAVAVQRSLGRNVLHKKAQLATKKSEGGVVDLGGFKIQDYIQQGATPCGTPHPSTPLKGEEARQKQSSITPYARLTTSSATPVVQTPRSALKAPPPSTQCICDGCAQWCP